MVKKIKKKKSAPITGPAPRTPLAAAFRDVAEPILSRVGNDPVPATMSWAMSVVATAWNASRTTDESEGLAALDRAIPKLLNPAFQDAEELAAILEQIFHLARVHHPRDPRHAVKLFVEKRGPADFHIEVVGGIPKLPKK